jgi:class 3 adenylate cyclase
MASPTSIGSICVVEDDAEVNRAVSELLVEQGYKVLSFASGTDFLSWWEQTLGNACELVISDISMPGASGFDLCRKVRARVRSQLLPIILVTGDDSPEEKAEGLDAGADDFIGKPFHGGELVAKVRSLMRIRAQELQTLSELHSARENASSLTRFISPSVADLLTSDARRAMLKPHRVDVTVMFSDLRRFTAFSGHVEPEEVLEVLGCYYTAVGTAALKHRGTLGNLAGDGIMIFFNDPEPIANHQETALRMALEVRQNLNELKKVWDQREYDIDFGIGLAQGYATIGGIGFDRFWQYTVIGTVTNFAARLCHMADRGQVLVSRRFLSRMTHASFEAEPVGTVTLKGIPKPVAVHNVLSLQDLVSLQEVRLRAV